MLLNRFALSFAFLIGSIGFASAAETLELDATNSKIEFVGKKSDGSHSGGFKKFTANAVADFDQPANGTLSIDIDATSLYSDDEKLTSHLKNPDFFDVRKHPSIKFKATKISAGEQEGKATITGDLTMLGKTESIEVPCTVAVSDKSITVDASFALDRFRWGMTYGEGKINKDVDVTAHLVFNR